MEESMNSNQNVGVNEMFNNEMKAAELKAREYLKGKDRKKCYFVSGHEVASDDELGFFTYVYFDDAKDSRIRELLVKIYNEAVDGADINSPSEIPSDFCLWQELETYNEELDALLFKPCEEHNILVDELDIVNPRYRYLMTMIPYDEEKGTVMEAVKFNIELTDDEYVYLLSKQIRSGNYFNYNKLMLENQKLAAKIDDTARRSYYLYEFDIDKPFLILFDEVRQDAEIISKQKK